MVVVCGKLISQWIVNAVFLLISLLFADNLKVYCFAYGLKQKNRVFVWWGLVLIAWLVLVILFGNRGGTRSEETKMILDYVTRALASLSIGAGLWLAKDLLLWSFAISFQSKNFFERILKAKFYKYVIDTLFHGTSVRVDYTARYGFFSWAEEMNKRKKSAFSIKLFLDVMSDDYKLKPNLDSGKKDQENANDAEPSATIIWNKLLERKSKLEGAKDAKGSDLKKFGERFKNARQDFFDSLPNRGSSVEDSSTIKREVFSDLFRTDGNLLQIESFNLLKDQKNSAANENKDVAMLFELTRETLQRSDRVKREDFNNWIENVYRECNSLESSLQNTRRAMEELNKLAKGIVIILIVIVWLLTMKVLSTQAVVLILSQFFVLTFVFGDSCKRIFEGILFVFVTHPFDIGDRCLIEDREEELIVKNINLQTTVFSRINPIDHKDGDDNKEKVVYPNSVLATKHICNFRKIPTPPKIDMTDWVEFVVDASTPVEKIKALNSRLRNDIMVRSQWIKDISVRVNGFEPGDKIKMGVYVTYKKFWKDNDEKGRWKSQIVLRLMQYLEDMGNSKDVTDSVEFVVDASTSIKQIEALNSRLREEIEEKGSWVKHISVHANGFEDGDKIKLGVYITYKHFWKDNEEKSAWKSKIVLGLKRILEDMGISKYPKKINVESAAAAIPPPVV